MGEKPKKWESPYVDHLKTGLVLSWLNYLYGFERIPIPKFKLPYPHVFYIFGGVDRG